jgi:hypothetical protein
MTGRVARNWLTHVDRDGCIGCVEPVNFTASVRYWNEEQQRGLAVIDVPDEHVEALGGLRQQRVHGTINGVDFTSNVMAAGGGRLAMSMPKSLQKSAGIGLGDEARVTITRVGKEEPQQR